MPTLELSAFADRLNQTLRRLKQYRTEPEWVAALLDGVAPCVDAAAVFTLENDRLRLRAAHRLELPGQLPIPLNLAPAFQTAVETQDTVVALRRAAEVSPSLSSSDPLDRALLIPILNGKRVVAVLFAATREPARSPTLELIAGMASIVLERQSNASAALRIAPAVNGTAAEPPPPPSRQLPYWAGLEEEQRRLHLRAKRFSRVKVAEMQLFQPAACHSGREQNNVYLFLKKEIDAARESFRDQFMSRPGMQDYLHLELIHTAADGDESKLGADYPGHLG